MIVHTRLLGCFAVLITVQLQAQTPLSIKDARVIVTAHDFNRCDSFPGVGDFGWPGNIQRASNGDLLLVHSWGYWHASFASPRLLEKETYRRYKAIGWPVDFNAPTGGRALITRSSDNGNTWSKPAVVNDYYLDDAAYGLVKCPDGTLCCFVNVQASWYGFDEAPVDFKKDINGLNSSQYVIRSSDDGKTWGKPIFIESPGSFYQRSHAQPLLLKGGTILWPTYATNGRNEEDHKLFGAIHRSDDSGKTWKLVGTVTRDGEHVDEPAIAMMKDGRLILVTRPDGALFYSDDLGKSWTQKGKMITEGYFKAPWFTVLNDGTVVCVATISTLKILISRDNGATWTEPIELDPSCYGYPGGMKMEDESIIVSYVERGQAPSRIYTARFRINSQRDGIELLNLGK